nr:hypothetical protein [Tanacetum cinerariifolium]
IQEEEDADELYRDVNINQGRGLQVTQNIKDTHVTLTPINPDGPQGSSSMSSFVSSMLNPISDVGVESIFTTTSSLIVSLETPTPIMTPSTIATITTSELHMLLQLTYQKWNSRRSLLKRWKEISLIQRSNEQRNLYKALVEAYEADKAILDTYGDSTILKRRREDDDQEGPSAGPNRGSKRQKEGGEKASASTPSEKATK